MDPGPLVTGRRDAGARFLGEFRKYVPIRAAFWVKPDGGEWTLYIASDRITDDNFDLAYGEVHRIAGALRDPEFDPFRVRLISTDDPLAEEIANFRRQYPGRTSAQVTGTSFGGLSVDEVYVYPTDQPVPAA